jgi:ABC-type protease/lipase transport system fused ATPase/permease subunit
VKKVASCILLVLLGLTLAIATPANADPSSASHTAQKNAKKLSKKNAKQVKRDRKMSQKATKDWKKRHQSGF